ncbi:resistance-nodulation-cell division superfamily protein [Thecamonas trahens ATCC 50062]|uniref:Resistance-nodulation-cell division superfamily protein n=1 Tax=Thecamonas trahens ATCC 50062 TaxID=461836 RepID=A0A0L0DW41_THETB|nr:resistance-nodulation-cell division superfamily protein [Thecamonas trahens ATCC 50062]KNC55733.1 resistance-nodulation-cell division superfamily protein [Thecamonas trahens ATCC 50062]|eukprot:XP_013752888.1 resistance-nodulation-cell division superfamily protein [Thecamonas trahens ATCC 50062]
MTCTWFPRAIVKHPWLVAGISLGSVILLGVFALAVFGIDSGGGDGTGMFLALGDAIVRQGLAYEAILKFSQDGVVIPQQSEATESLVVFFSAHSGRAFTPEGLAAIRTAQRRLMSVAQYEDFCLRDSASGNCTAPVSPLRMFYTDDTGEGEPRCGGGELDQACIDGIVRAQLDGNGTVVGDNKVFFSRMFSPTTLRNPVTRLIIQFGGPLKGYSSRSDGEDAQEDAFKTLMKEYVQVFKELDNNGAVSGYYKVNHLGSTIISLEVVSYIMGDLLLAMGSVVLVYAFMAYFTFSPLLAAMGLLHILCSFFGAYFLYRVVFQIKVWPLPAVLGFLLLFGVGADDVFVFVDAWKQVSHLPAAITSDPVARMTVTYKRAASAMFVTSFTTFVAFAATAASPLPAIASFGIFSAALIAVNYLLVITWFPAIVWLWSKHCAHRCCFRATDRFAATHELTADQDGVELEEQEEEASGPSSGSGFGSATSDAEATSPHGSDDDGSVVGEHAHNIENMRFMERFFHNIYAPQLFKIRWGVVVVFVIALGLFIGPENGLPSGSQAHDAVELNENAFDPDPASEVNTIRVIFGVAGLERETASGKKLDRNEQGKVGRLIFDPSFSLAPPAAQQFLVDFCAQVKAATCASCGTTPSVGNLVLQSGLDDSRCFMTEFAAWVTTVRNGSFPVAADAFNSELAAFLETPDAVSIRSGRDVLLDANGVPLYAVLNFVTPINVVESNPVMRKWFDVWVGVTASAQPPASLTTRFATLGAGASPESFAWMRTFELLVASVYTTLAISLALAFGMLVLATANVLLAILAFVALVTIAGAIVSTMVVFGFTLGVNESLGLVICVGLAVDYTVHLAHSYNESEASGHLPRARQASRMRLLKTQYALTEMGVSIVGGAVTTLSSGAILVFFCKLLFFKRFGSLIFMTILCSLFISMLYLVSLLFTLGPLGNAGRIKVALRWAYVKMGGKSGAVLRWLA